MPHTPQHRQASTVNQVLRTQARQNQQGQSPNVAAINVANLQQQAGGFAPQLQPVARAISQGTTVPQLRVQNIANQQARANVGLTQAQAGQVAELNRTNLRIARQPVREQRVQQAGQLATSTQQGADAFRTGAAQNVANLSVAALNQAGQLGAAGIQAGAQERIAQAQTQAGTASALISAQLQQAAARNEIPVAVLESFKEFAGKEGVTLDEILDFAAESGIQNIIDLGVLGIAPPARPVAPAAATPTVPQVGGGVGGAGEAVGEFARGAATAPFRFFEGLSRGVFPPTPEIDPFANR